MAGVILFIRALLSHIEVELGGAEVWLELGTGHPETGTGSPEGHALRAVPDEAAEQRQAPAA